MKIRYLLVLVMAVALISVPAMAQDDCTTAIAVPGPVDPCVDDKDQGMTGGNCISGGGVLDSWLFFVAQDTSARIRSDLNSSGSDSDYNVYSGSCGTLTHIGCSEDEGDGFLGDISIDKLIVGDTYYIQLGIWSDTTSACGDYVIDIGPVPGAVCGDGVVSLVPGREECDGADADACILSCLSDCTCEPVITPALPIWGIAGLALLLLVGGAFAFRRNSAEVA